MTVSWRARAYGRQDNANEGRGRAVLPMKDAVAPFSRRPRARRGDQSRHTAWVIGACAARQSPPHYSAQVRGHGTEMTGGEAVVWRAAVSFRAFGASARHPRL